MTGGTEVAEVADGTEIRCAIGGAGRGLTVGAVRAGEIGVADLRLHPGTLERRSVVAEENGNPRLAENLRAPPS